MPVARNSIRLWHWRQTDMQSSAVQTMVLLEALTVSR
jgi:hypothetical protein